ncbi:unnamed protein product [Miscanthus lutarioriparius]|uniref:Uncharacterized protein n=1 Tax=Miscanthus lutarioriparius TaxID=422564 RepID=A0A811P675_9POAL|nr:unnamed protein product [Miscanthus lutarioriparius]
MAEKAAAPWPASAREQAATLLPGKRASELPRYRRRYRAALPLARGYTFARRVLLIRKQRRRHQQVSLPSYRYLRHPPSTSQLKRATHRRTTEWASIWAVLQRGGGPISLMTGDFAHTAFTGARGEAGRSRGVPQGRSGQVRQRPPLFDTHGPPQITSFAGARAKAVRAEEDRVGEKARRPGRSHEG